MRKRKKLEVSTFPFLAVLLCTMGALILLLLVMDKKAKKAALEKAYEAAWTQSKNLQAKTDAEKQNQDKKIKSILSAMRHSEYLLLDDAIARPDPTDEIVLTLSLALKHSRALLPPAARATQPAMSL